MTRHITKLLVLAALFLCANSAFAQTLNPAGGNAWDVYVTGNGRVLYDILTSVKSLVVPDAGSSGFLTLMTVVATLGLFVMVVQAMASGQPQGFARLFTYMVAVFFVAYTTVYARMNLTVNDRSSSYYNTVASVPVSVGLPAAMVSQVGNYFTTGIETYFNYPDPSLALAKANGGVGQFNLMGRMLKESEQYNFRSKELRDSYRAYMSDCVIPAMARHRLEGQDGKGNTLKGEQALIDSNDLLETMGTAAFNSVLTRYFVRGGTSPDTSTPAYQQLAAAGGTDNEGAVLKAQGVIVSCNEAYRSLVMDTAKDASDLLGASADAWSRTGVLVTLEQAHVAMMAGVGAGSGSGGRLASYASPQTYIQQTAVINTLNGAYRGAAMSLGNNEALLATSISQAEQNQRAGWVASFYTFNNMMGYVYSVLQAFVFAISPFILVAILIPGLGGAILKNYMQILLWMALWDPMLAVINYLITLYGVDMVGPIYQAAGGPTLGIKAAVSVRTENLIMAAQFLGTMVPMITWGIVKGSIAFTEFIQHGIGSSFAMQAGATAASGNMSMGQISMNNTSMNKLDTSMASSVGFSGTTGYYGAGAGLMQQQGGGVAAQINGSGVSTQAAMSESVKKSISDAQAVSSALAKEISEGRSYSEAVQNVLSKSTGSQHQIVAAAQSALAEKWDHEQNSRQNVEGSTSAKRESGSSVQESATQGTKVGAGVGGGKNPFSANVGLDAGVTDTSSKSASNSRGDAGGYTRSAGSGASTGSGFNTSESGGSSDSLTTAFSRAASATKTDSHSDSESLKALQQTIDTYATNVARESSFSVTSSYSQGGSLDMPASIGGAGQALSGAVDSQLQGSAGRAGATSGAVAPAGSLRGTGGAQGRPGTGGLEGEVGADLRSTKGSVGSASAGIAERGAATQGRVTGTNAAAAEEAAGRFRNASGR